jgi:hypothetical protein
MAQRKYQAAYSDQANWSDTYLTDPALVRALGPFAVDPACPPGMPWKTARRMLTPAEDGLTASWGRGRAWCNPPYRRVDPWAARFVEHGSGVILLSGRATGTRATQLIMSRCAAVYLLAGRLGWWKIDGQPYVNENGVVPKFFSSLLIGMTVEDADKLAGLPAAGFPGTLLLGPALADTFIDLGAKS